jgi:hypothetical protein
MADIIVTFSHIEFGQNKHTTLGRLSFTNAAFFLDFGSSQPAL